MENQKIISSRFRSPQTDLSTYECKICKKIPLIQTFCDECVNVYCRDCLEIGKNCVDCQSKVDQPPRLFSTIFETLQVQCDFHENGCQEVIRMVNLASHEKNCKYKLLTCLNAPCFFKGTSMDIEKHQESCNYRKISCSKCGANYLSLENHNCIVFLKNRLNSLATKIETAIPRVPLEALTQLIVAEMLQKTQLKIDRKCNQGHRLTYFPVNHPSNIYKCNDCQIRIKEIRIGSYQCETCTFSLCLICFAGKSKCKRGHILTACEGTGPYICCDLCRSRGMSMTFFGCRDCDYDECQKCFVNKL